MHYNIWLKADQIENKIFVVIIYYKSHAKYNMPLSQNFRYHLICSYMRLKPCIIPVYFKNFPSL